MTDIHIDADPLKLVPVQPEWLRGGTIFLTKYGSHAYGTSTPESDLDLRGIAVAPEKYYLGCSKKFEQAISATPVDLCIYDIRKFLNLAADCNPSIIEILWVDESDVLFQTHAAEVLRANREMFLSQKAKHTFSGYAASQMKRIETHRRWILNPVVAPPVREDYDLPERRLLSADQQGAALALIQQLIDSWELDLSDLDDARRIYIMEQLAKVIEERTSGDETRQAGRLLGFGDNMLDYLDREKRYAAAQRQWEQYNQWKKERNPVRAALEAKMGYDGKHASHLVRLMRLCREILEGKGVIVRRSDAKELLEIRNGAWTYAQLREFCDREDKDLNAVMRMSKLPKTPPRDKIDDLCVDLIQSSPGFYQ